MRKLIIKILGTMVSFYVASTFVAGMSIDHTATAFLIASVVFVLTNLLISPIIKLLLLPINLITLGLFRWITSIIVLYIFDLLYDGVTISAYTFPGYTSGIVALPATNLPLFWTLLLISLIMSLTYTIFTSLIQAE